MQAPPADPNAAPPPPQAQPPVGSVPQPGMDDILYEGIAKHSANIGAYLMWTFVCVLGGVFGYFLMKIPALSGYPMWVLSLIGVPMLLWAYLVHIKHKYKISRRRVEVERGVLTTKLDTLELWRVLDVRYERSILDQMFDNAKIFLVGTDQTDPVLVLYGMPNHRQLFERIRDAVQFARHSNRPMELAGHGHGHEHELTGGVQEHH
jgi:membrane protein YdbS with pleckstrin-like domain